MDSFMINRGLLLRHNSLAAALVFLSLAACTNFSEVYYVGAFDPTSQPSAMQAGAATQPSGYPLPTQFYRYHISGYSLWSNTRFEAGLYDAKAVDTLFGDVSPPTT